VRLFSKNSELRDHNPPTSQTDRPTDRRTDDMRSQNRASLRGNKMTKIQMSKKKTRTQYNTKNKPMQLGDETN